ncbi:hypothetical protein EVAR_43131_1 [Eumeta japonica]|uniref:Uncharacterized protein n=1 Tax=Eumeta variegata TaxID=151549 RepID=A0A4C1XR12_EUMVA|nr:hypothetical protein EVAR_43131_1 [Eumeta japonica]
MQKSESRGSCPTGSRAVNFIGTRQNEIKVLIPSGARGAQGAGAGAKGRRPFGARLRRPAVASCGRLDYFCIRRGKISSGGGLGARGSANMSRPLGALQMRTSIFNPRRAALTIANIFCTKEVHRPSAELAGDKISGVAWSPQPPPAPPAPPYLRAIIVCMKIVLQYTAKLPAERPAETTTSAITLIKTATMAS